VFSVFYEFFHRVFSVSEIVFKSLISLPGVDFYFSELAYPSTCCCSTYHVHQRVSLLHPVDIHELHCTQSQTCVKVEFLKIFIFLFSRFSVWFGQLPGMS